MTNMTGLKINLHITQHCNFHCRYCFAKFHSPKDLSGSDWQRIMDNLKQSGMVDRLNFAGGEPVLHRDFVQIVNYAFEQGFALSIISNGSLMTNSQLFPRDLFKKFSMLGLSLDSLNPHTLRQLGCCDSKKQIFGKNELLHVIWLAKTENPQLQIKLNTVVNSLNKDEEIASLGQTAAIDRWKFFKMKPFENQTFSNKTLQITDEEFTAFLAQNSCGSKDNVPEYSMDRSYIIIDNAGNLIDNHGEEDYQVVGNLLEEPFAEIFSRYHFDADLYQSRYDATAAAAG